MEKDQSGERTCGGINLKHSQVPKDRRDKRCQKPSMMVDQDVQITMAQPKEGEGYEGVCCLPVTAELYFGAGNRQTRYEHSQTSRVSQTQAHFFINIQRKAFPIVCDSS